MIQYHINCGDQAPRCVVEIRKDGTWIIVGDITEEERKNALVQVTGTAAQLLKEGMILRDAILDTLKTMELARAAWSNEQMIGHQSNIAQHLRRDYEKLKNLTAPTKAEKAKCLNPMGCRPQTPCSACQEEAS